MAVLLILATAPDVPPAATQAAAFWQSWLFWVLVGAGLLVATVAVFFVHYLRISLRLFLTTQMPMTGDVGNGCRLDGELHEFPSRDGTSLVGLFIDPPLGVAVRGTIVFAHEFNGERHTAARYTRGLGELGFRIFTFDFRGHGASGNSGGYQPMHWVTDHEVDDLLAAVRYVEATAPAADHPVGVMGVSRGACAAAIAAFHRPTLRALAFDGLFSTDMMMEGLMKRWARIFAGLRIVRPNHPPEAFGILRVFTLLYAELKLRCRYPLVRRTLPRLKDVPVLFLYGSEDAYIDEEQRIKLYRVKPGIKQLAVIDGAKHNQAVVVRPEVYRQTVAAFFDQHMPAAPQGPSGG